MEGAVNNLYTEQGIIIISRGGRETMCRGRGGEGERGRFPLDLGGLVTTQVEYQL